MSAMCARLLCLIFVCATVVRGKDCPNGWRPYDQSCYLFRSNTDTWVNAKVICDAVHGKLVEIESAEENNFVNNLLVQHSARYAWIGLQDFAVEGEFVWTSSEQTAVEYSNWLTNEPNDQNGQDCATIQAGGLWDDVECSANDRAIVCERQ